MLPLPKHLMYFKILGWAFFGIISSSSFDHLINWEVRCKKRKKKKKKKYLLKVHVNEYNHMDRKKQTNIKQYPTFVT